MNATSSGCFHVFDNRTVFSYNIIRSMIVPRKTTSRIYFILRPYRGRSWENLLFFSVFPYLYFSLSPLLLAYKYYSGRCTHFELLLLLFVHYNRCGWFYDETFIFSVSTLKCFKSSPRYAFSSCVCVTTADRIRAAKLERMRSPHVMSFRSGHFCVHDSRYSFDIVV